MVLGALATVIAAAMATSYQFKFPRSKYEERRSTIKHRNSE
jgi:hypothetical protein